MFRCSVLCFLTVVLSANIASAQLNLAPDGLSAGDQFRYVFVTDEFSDATSSAISTYDDFVTEQANQAGSLFLNQGLTFQVIGSTASVNAISHIGIPGVDVPLVLVDGTFVADSNSDFFDGTFDNNLNITQSGQELIAGGEEVVFTGTQSNGLGASTEELGTASGSSAFSLANLTAEDGLTPVFFPFSQDFDGRFFGISSVVTVAAVPEPSSLVVLGCVAFGLVSRRRRVVAKNV